MDEMLQEMTVEEFDERFAAWEMSGDADRWLQVSWIITTVCNQVTRYLASKSTEPMPDEAYLDPDHLMPIFMRPKRTKRRQITPDTVSGGELLAKHLGAL